jgi:hypothetical protein
MARLLRASACNSRPATSSDWIPWEDSLRAGTAAVSGSVDRMLGLNYDPFNLFH